MGIRPPRAPAFLRRAIATFQSAVVSAARSVRLRRLAAAGAVCAIVAVGLLQVRISTDVSSFLPAKDPTVQQLRDHDRAFGGDPILVVLETDQPEGLLAPEVLPRIVGLEGRLATLPQVATVYGPGTALNQIATQAQNLIAQISGRRDALRAIAQQQATAAGNSPSQVAAAVEQSTKAFDLRYGSLLVQGLPAGLPTLRNPTFVHTVLATPDGALRPQWRYLVPSPGSVVILVRPDDGLDQDSTAQLLRAVRSSVTDAHLPTGAVTISGTPTLTAALSDQARRELPRLAIVALIVVALCFLPARWMGRRRRRLLPLAVAALSTTLVLSVAGWVRAPLSLGAVAFLPVLFGVSSFYPLYLVNNGNRRRVVVAAAATATSFASLYLSPLPFVRELGVSLAAGVLVALALSLLVLRWRPGLRAVPYSDADPGAGDQGPPSRRYPIWQRGLLLAALAAVAALGWARLPTVAVTAEPQRLAQGLAAIVHAEHTEQVLGSSGEVDVVLHGPDVLTPEALGWTRAAQTAITLSHGDALQPVVSAPDLLRFLGAQPSAEAITAGARLIPPYLRDTVLSKDGHRSLIAFGIRLQDLGTQSRLIADIRTQLPPPPPGYRAEVVGLPVAAARGYDLVSQSRYTGNLAGIAAAAVVLLLGLRRRTDALRAVLAASLATGWGLALIWVTGQQLSPLTVGLGSLTAAVGCEFTVLLAYAERGRRRALRRSVAIAAVTSAAGFAVLTLSELNVMRQFGIFLATSVLLCYLASRLVLWIAPTDKAGVVLPDPSTDDAGKHNARTPA